MAKVADMSARTPVYTDVLYLSASDGSADGKATFQSLSQGFYATGYGVTNSGDKSTELQAAIDAAAGGTCYVDVSCNAQGITVPSNTELVGLGDGITITLNASADTHLLKNSDQVSGNTGITIRNLKLNANRANQSTGLGANVSHAIYMLSVTDLTIDNVRVSNAMDNGAKIDACTTVNIRNFEIDGAGTDGVSLDNSTDIRWDGGRFLNCDGKDGQGNDRPGASSCYGLEIEDQVQEAQFTDLYFDTCNRAGGLNIQNHDSDGPCKNLTFNGIVIKDCALTSFNLSGTATNPTSYVTVTGLVITNGERGIRFSNANNVSISSFQIETGQAAATLNYGLWWDGNCANNYLSNGFVTDDSIAVQIDTGLTITQLMFDNVSATATGSDPTLSVDLGITDFVWRGGRIENTGTGQALYWDAAFTHPALFEGVTFYADNSTALGAERACIYFNENSTGCRLVDCVILGGDNSNGLVKLDGTNSHVTISKCKFYNPNNQPAVAIDALCTHNSILYNWIDACATGGGFAIGGGGQANLFIGNRFTNCSQGINLTGDDSIAVHNVGDGVTATKTVVDGGTGNTTSPNIEI